MKEKMICRGDLFYYDFGDNSGSVQSGERPVLVVQADDYNQNAPTIIVAAVTSVIKKRYLPSHILQISYIEYALSRYSSSFLLLISRLLPFQRTKGQNSESDISLNFLEPIPQ